MDPLDCIKIKLICASLMGLAAQEFVLCSSRLLELAHALDAVGNSEDFGLAV
jgi:hypothetical protein